MYRFLEWNILFEKVRRGRIFVISYLRFVNSYLHIDSLTINVNRLYNRLMKSSGIMYCYYLVIHPLSHTHLTPLPKAAAACSTENIVLYVPYTCKQQFKTPEVSTTLYLSFLYLFVLTLLLWINFDLHLIFTMIYNDNIPNIKIRIWYQNCVSFLTFPRKPKNIPGFAWSNIFINISGFDTLQICVQTLSSHGKRINAYNSTDIYIFNALRHACVGQIQIQLARCLINLISYIEYS